MDISFQWIGGACLILEINELRIAVDPCLCPKGTVQDYFWFKSKRIEKPVYLEKDFEDIDLWLLTHNHEDHIDKLGSAKISKQSTIITASNVEKILRQSNLNKYKVLKWGNSTILKIKTFEIKIEAIPAIHGINPMSAFFAGRVNGYYLTITSPNSTKHIYITSDTVYKRKVINAIRNRPIDLLIPNMGAAKQGSWIMTLTMNSKMLIRMISKLQPKLVIPIHFGTFSHYKEPIEKIKEINDSRIQIVSVGSRTKIVI